jgi:Tfp pilus assembly protein PilO
MPQTPIPNIIQRVLNFSLILIFLSMFIVVVIGGATKGIRKEVKGLNAFLAGTETLHENFERSLSMYTDEPRRIIDYVLDIRPETEMEYIDFIGEVEHIGIDQGLDLDLESIGQTSLYSTESTLGYHVKFFGGEQELEDFIHALEHMPYYVRVDSVDYKTLDLLDADSQPNINLKIYLYVRETQ